MANALPAIEATGTKGRSWGLLSKVPFAHQLVWKDDELVYTHRKMHHHTEADFEHQDDAYLGPSIFLDVSFSTSDGS
jgi:hypothetical protein